MKERKAQAFISDFTVSIAVFSIIVAAFFVPWNTIVQSDQRFSTSEKMKTQAQRTAAFLVTTEGYPRGWENESVNVSIPGFSQRSDNLLSPEKIQEFGNMSYDRQRSLLKAQNFYLAIVNRSGTVKVDGRPLSFGKDPRAPGNDPETVVVVERDVIVGEQNINSGKLQYMMWRNRR
ncbi:MAG: hypothetical protein ABEJ87_06060 [Candidatus Nanohalobium sp.]